ncbi:MAG TPA: hypothetical protein VNI34_05035 [Candidatus Nitrosotalea sp.]|nr:hypothetical protein [Candidatus Nitrosotalea sp.]
MWLVCSQGCGGSLFRSLFAEIDVDPGGAYLDHRLTQPGHVCLNCGAPALDLGAVPGAMAQDDADDVPNSAAEVLCPVCETLVMVAMGEECPNCGAELEWPEASEPEE